MREVSNIQVLRGLAALAIVVFHAQGELAPRGYADPLPDLTAGAFGVDVFFTISGFIMVYASVPLFGRMSSIVPFVIRRLCRIVPLYWLVTLIYVIELLHQTRHESDHQALWVNLAASLGFVSYLVPTNDSGYPVYSLGWTLEYELFFYGCFAIFLLMRRDWAVAGLTLTFSTLVGMGLADLIPDPWAHLAATQILEFVAGMAIAQLYLGGRALRPITALALLVAAVCIVAWSVAGVALDDWWRYRGFVWGIPAALTVAAAALWRPRRHGGRLRGALQRLGDASYSLYLIHYALYVAIAMLFPTVIGPRTLPALGYFGLLVISAIVACRLTYRCFEAPTTRYCQALLLRKFPAGARAPLPNSAPQI